MFRLRGDLASIGEVDQALMKEAKDTEARYAFLAKESEDLEKAVARPYEAHAGTFGEN